MPLIVSRRRDDSRVIRKASSGSSKLSGSMAATAGALWQTTGTPRAIALKITVLGGLTNSAASRSSSEIGRVETGQS